MSGHRKRGLQFLLTELQGEGLPDGITKGRATPPCRGTSTAFGQLQRWASPPEQLQRERAPRVSGTERDGLLQCAASARFPHSAFLLSGQLEREASACRASPSPGPPTSSEVCPVPHSCARVVRGPPTGKGVVGLSWEQPRLAWWSIPFSPGLPVKPGQSRSIPVNPVQSRSPGQSQVLSGLLIMCVPCVHRCLFDYSERFVDVNKWSELIVLRCLPKTLSFLFKDSNS